MGPKINIRQNSCGKVVFDITLGDSVIQSVTDNDTELTYDYKYTIRDTAGSHHTIKVVDFNNESDTVELEVEGHDYQLYKQENPTCTSDGYKKFRCTFCGETYTEKIDSTGHHYAVLMKVNPTCTEQGYTIYRCSSCNDTYNDDFIEPTGHNYEINRLEPTCTEAGKIITSCTKCDEISIEEIPALGHDWVMIDGTDATYEKPGHGIYECSRCHETKEEDIPKKEYGAGKEINLAMCPVYSTPYLNTIEGYISGTYYQWYERQVNNRIKIACHKEHCKTAGMIVGWIDKSYIDKTIEIQKDIFFKMGDSIDLAYGTVYPTHTSEKGDGLKSGTYYISGSKIINNRIPITDNPDSIGYNKDWVGWIDINKITIENNNGVN